MSESIKSYFSIPPPPSLSVWTFKTQTDRNKLTKRLLVDQFVFVTLKFLLHLLQCRLLGGGGGGMRESDRKSIKSEDNTLIF